MAPRLPHDVILHILDELLDPPLIPARWHFRSLSLPTPHVVEDYARRQRQRQAYHLVRSCLLVSRTWARAVCERLYRCPPLFDDTAALACASTLERSRAGGAGTGAGAGGTERTATGSGSGMPYAWFVRHLHVDDLSIGVVLRLLMAVDRLDSLVLTGFGAAVPLRLTLCRQLFSMPCFATLRSLSLGSDLDSVREEGLVRLLMTLTTMPLSSGGSHGAMDDQTQTQTHGGEDEREHRLPLECLEHLVVQGAPWLGPSIVKLLAGRCKRLRSLVVVTADTVLNDHVPWTSLVEPLLDRLEHLTIAGNMAWPGQTENENEGEGYGQIQASQHRRSFADSIAGMLPRVKTLKLAVPVAVDGWVLRQLSLGAEHRLAHLTALDTRGWIFPANMPADHLVSFAELVSPQLRHLAIGPASSDAPANDHHVRFIVAALAVARRLQFLDIPSSRVHSDTVFMALSSGPKLLQCLCLGSPRLDLQEDGMMDCEGAVPVVSAGHWLSAAERLYAGIVHAAVSLPRLQTVLVDAQDNELVTSLSRPQMPETVPSGWIAPDPMLPTEGLSACHIRRSARLRWPQALDAPDLLLLEVQTLVAAMQDK